MEPAGGGSAEEEAPEKEEHALGMDLDETMHTVSGMGTLLSEQGNIKEAEVFWRRGPRSSRSAWTLLLLLLDGQVQPRRAFFFAALSID